MSILPVDPCEAEMTLTTLRPAAAPTAPAGRWHVAVTDPALAPAARRIVAAVLRDADRRVGTERSRGTVWRLARGGGAPVVVGPTDARLVAVALEAARLTGGLVDPTVGTAVLQHAAGRDGVRAARSGALPRCGTLTAPRPRPAVGWESVRVAGPAVSVPAGTLLDLAATTDPVAAHAAARAVADRLRTGALVGVGGDVVQAGPMPPDGWGVLLPDGTVVRLGAGRSLATVRPGAGRVVDPRNGAVAAPVWSAVTVVHPDPLTAKAYALAAAVLGEEAPDWLARRAVTYRLVRADGGRLASPGWPRDVRPVPVPLPSSSPPPLSPSLPAPRRVA